jgi:Flp pilus assembly protein TadB
MPPAPRGAVGGKVDLWTRGKWGEDGVAGDNRKPAKQRRHAPSQDAALQSGGEKPGGPKPPADRPKPPADAVDLRVQLPYFAARLAAFVALAVVLIVVGISPLFAILLGLAAAGLLTWPLGRMQRRAAQRAARRPPDK